MGFKVLWGKSCTQVEGNRQEISFSGLCVEVTALGTGPRCVLSARRDIAGVSRMRKEGFYRGKKAQSTGLAHLHPPDGGLRGAVLGTRCAQPPRVAGNLSEGGQKGIWAKRCYMVTQVQHRRAELLLVTGVSPFLGSCPGFLRGPGWFALSQNLHEPVSSGASSTVFSPEIALTS